MTQGEPAFSECRLYPPKISHLTTSLRTRSDFFSSLLNP